MLISGQWLLCEDGVVRPVIKGEVRAAAKTWHPVLSTSKGSVPQKEMRPIST